MKKVLYSIIFGMLISTAWTAPMKVKIGTLQTRGILWQQEGPAPAILMLPGSGPQGPEEMIPGAQTADGKDHSIFSPIAERLWKSGFVVLQLGKPGVDSFTDWNNLFYDIKLLQDLNWNGLINNAQTGLDYLKSLPEVQKNKLFILGHSEGTQVAVELAQTQKIQGLILLGFSGEDLITSLRWQLFEREIDYFIKSDVDQNRNGLVSREEASKFTEFNWKWSSDQQEVSIEEISQSIKNQIPRQKIMTRVLSSTWCSDGHCESGPIYKKTAKLNTNLYVITGEKDLQTRAEEALKLKEECNKQGKQNCEIHIIPDLQHGLNFPKAPRFHPLLDIAVGPVEESFLDYLVKLAKKISL